MIANIFPFPVIIVVIPAKMYDFKIFPAAFFMSDGFLLDTVATDALSTRFGWGETTISMDTNSSKSKTIEIEVILKMICHACLSDKLGLSALINWVYLLMFNCGDFRVPYLLIN